MGLSIRINKHKSALLTILVFTFLSVSLVVYAFFLYFAVGTERDRSWYFGVVEDVPGSSRYSTSATRQFFLNATSPEKGGKVSRQHVMGEKESSTETNAVDRTRSSRR